MNQYALKNAILNLSNIVFKIRDALMCFCKKNYSFNFNASKCNPWT